jgi:hypothetical protein
MLASITRLFHNITQQPGFIKNTHDGNPSQTNIESKCCSVSWQPGLIRNNEDFSSVKNTLDSGFIGNTHDFVTSNSKKILAINPILNLSVIQFLGSQDP